MARIPLWEGRQKPGGDRLKGGHLLKRGYGDGSREETKGTRAVCARGRGLMRSEPPEAPAERADVGVLEEADQCLLHGGGWSWRGKTAMPECRG